MPAFGLRKATSSKLTRKALETSVSSTGTLAVTSFLAHPPLPFRDGGEMQESL